MKNIKTFTLDIDIKIEPTEDKMAKDVAKIIEESIQVQQGWEKFGGSFLKGLSQALLHADIHNVLKILNTWPKEWEMGLEFYQDKIRISNTEVANED